MRGKRPGAIARVLEHQSRMLVGTMRDLYRHAWERLREDRRRCPEIDRETTPVLFFGTWQTARVATAGLNPSEDEFWTKPVGSAGRKPLQGAAQRFLHWDDGVLTDARLHEAFRRMEGYFTLGNAYALWFNRYRAFLRALRMPFESGLACHTDYVSPFATRTGISKCPSATQRLLKEHGGPAWLDVLVRCPALKIVFGHGHGWRGIPRWLAEHDGWKPIPTPFDGKGGKSAGQHLCHCAVRLPDGRRIAVYWWKPNRDGAPLCFLGESERAAVGELIRSHFGASGR